MGRRERGPIGSPGSLPFCRAVAAPAAHPSPGQAVPSLAPCSEQTSPFLPCMEQTNLFPPMHGANKPFSLVHGANEPFSSMHGAKKPFPPVHGANKPFFRYAWGKHSFVPSWLQPQLWWGPQAKRGCSPHLVPHHEVLGSTQKAKAHPNPSKDLQSGCCSPSPSHAAPPTPQTILVPRGGLQQRGASSSCLLGWAARQSWPQRWAGTAQPPRTQHGTDEDVMQWNLLSFILLKKHQAREGFAAS